MERLLFSNRNRERGKIREEIELRSEREREKEKGEDFLLCLEEFLFRGPSCGTNIFIKTTPHIYKHIYIYMYTLFYYIHTHIYIYTLFYLISYIYTHTQKKKKFSIFNQNYV